jgi:uncharacterized membrane protein YbhN (UPF0104 family)
MRETPVEAAEAPAEARARRMTARRLLRLGFLAVAVALGAWAVARQWSAVRSAVVGIGPVAAACALLAVLAGLVATMQLWRGLLAAAGSPLPVPAAARIFFVGQLGKYVPGSIWPIVAQMELASVHHVPRRRSVTSAVLTMLISLAAALLVALVAVPVIGGRETVGYRWILLAVPALVAGLHPRVLNPILDRLLRLARRPPLEAPVTGQAVAAALGWAVLSWVLLGAHIWVLAIRLGAPPGRALAFAIGGFAFAWSAGFLAVFAPAGAGIRDVLLVASLTPVTTLEQATAITLLSRVLMTAGDLLAAAAASGTHRYGRQSVRQTGAVGHSDRAGPT